VFELSLPLFLVVIFFPLAPFLFYLDVSTESSKLSSSIVTVPQASQVTFVFYQPLSSTIAVLLNFSGCGCLLPTQVQRVYQDLFKFNGLYSVLLKFKVLFKVYSSLKQLFKVISGCKVSIKVYPTSTFLRIYWSLVNHKSINFKCKYKSL
jgi:hypothetical protein